MTDDTALLPLEEIAEKILDAADYFQSAADQGEGFLASKIIDPLMICHGELLKRAARLNCPVCGYTEKDARFHGDHSLCSNKNPPWNTHTNPNTLQCPRPVIKPLEWDRGKGWYCQTPVMHFAIGYTGTWYHLAVNGQHKEDYKTLEEAKAAAETYFQAKIWRVLG